MNIFNKFPVIKIDENITLRQFNHNDAQNYLDYMSDEDINFFIPNECIPKNLEESKNDIEDYINFFKYKRSIYWAISTNIDDNLIGSIGFNYYNREQYRSEISYDLAKKFWNKKIMTKCLNAALSFGFISMNLERIEATVLASNKTSVKLLQRAKFKKEGILRKHKLLRGNFYDAIMMSILKDEYINF